MILKLYYGYLYRSVECRVLVSMNSNKWYIQTVPFVNLESYTRVEIKVAGTDISHHIRLMHDDSTKKFTVGKRYL